MKKCKHENPRGLTWDGEGYGWMTGGDDARVCRWCGAWLPLGPSDETATEAVRTEVLAAFLLNPGGFVSVAHKDHHDQEWIDENYNYEFREDCIGCQAEHLATVIAEHEEPIGDLIARSSIGAGLRNIKERGIEAETETLTRELDGLCARALHGIDYPGQPCDLCAKETA